MNEEMQLLSIELHEEIVIDESCSVVCVLGGWIYKFYRVANVLNTTGLVSTVFVPRTKE